MAVKEIDELPDELKRELIRFVGHCSDCGKTIVKCGAKKRCTECQDKRIRKGVLDYQKKNFTSVRYEHDKYISGRK